MSELAPLMDRVLGVQIKRLADKLAAPAEAKLDKPPG